MFSFEDAKKLRELVRDPRASLVVARPAGEIEQWVAVGRPEHIDRLLPWNVDLPKQSEHYSVG